MSSRLFESMETDSAGWVIWRRRFGRGGSWANAGATRTAHTISIGMLRTALVASNKFSPSPTMQSTPADLRRHLFSAGRCASPSPGDAQTVNATVVGAVDRGGALARRQRDE